MSSGLALLTLLVLLPLASGVACAGVALVSCRCRAREDWLATLREELRLDARACACEGCQAEARKAGPGSAGGPEEATTTTSGNDTILLILTMTKLLLGWRSSREESANQNTIALKRNWIFILVVALPACHPDY